MSRRRAGRTSSRVSRVPVVLGMLVVAVLAIGLGYLGYVYWKGRTERATDPETGCLANAPTPRAVLFLIDATDRLSSRTAARIRSRIDDAVANLPRYSRVIVVPFGGDVAVPLEPVFNGCVPGRASTAAFDEGELLLEENYREFERALDATIQRLERLPSARTSPIAAQVERAASDTQLHWRGTVRTLVLMTDGLESSVYWTGRLALSDPAEQVLNGVQAEYFELGNQRDSAMQTRQVRLEWQSWLERAGAEVRMTAPGFAAANTPMPATEAE